MVQRSPCTSTSTHVSPRWVGCRGSDLVLRWDGKIRLIDIKSGHSGSAFADSLQHQLRFYAWLWSRTNEQGTVEKCRRYSSSKERQLALPQVKRNFTTDEEFFQINQQMREMGEGASILPAEGSNEIGNHMQVSEEGAVAVGVACLWKILIQQVR